MCGNDPVVKNYIYIISDLDLWPNDPKINPIYFGVITIIPFDNLYRRVYFVMHTFLVIYQTKNKSQKNNIFVRKIDWQKQICSLTFEFMVLILTYDLSLYLYLSLCNKFCGLIESMKTTPVWASYRVYVSYRQTVMSCSPCSISFIWI
jgi:hypothetical protein